MGSEDVCKMAKATGIMLTPMYKIRVKPDDMVHKVRVKPYDVCVSI